MISFTGSTEVGRVLLAGRRPGAEVVMELGGNAPFVVFDDADLDAAVEGAMVAKMRHSAETCTAANRFFVEASVGDEFTENRRRDGQRQDRHRLRRRRHVRTADQRRRARAVDALVKVAVGAGARSCSAGRRRRPGFFFEPTVLADVEPDSPITREEIFGPVAPVIPFTDTDTMIDQANDTEMGLTGYVYTRDLAKGLRVTERIQAGMIGLNRGAVSDPAAPFGGMKQSGLGREGASEGIYEFCETQYIATSW